MSILKEFKYPVIQGGMANIATAELASAVTNAGGLGIIGTGGWDASRTEEELLKMEKLVGDKHYGVNIMMMNPAADEIMEVLIKHKIKYVTAGAGNPGKYVAKLKKHGIKIMPVVPSVALAKRMEKVDVDAVIVEGTESGGHVGELTTMALVPQIVNAVDIEVIAAGGIASNRQFVAALALGASGVQIGTSLLGTKEVPIHEKYQKLILDAKDTSTTVTGRVKGVPVRSLKTKMTREYTKLEATDISWEELELMTLGSLRKAVFDGNTDEGSFMAGQVAGQVNELKTVAQLLADICNVEPIMNELGSKVNEINKNKK